MAGRVSPVGRIGERGEEENNVRTLVIEYDCGTIEAWKRCNWNRIVDIFCGGWNRIHQSHHIHYFHNQQSTGSNLIHVDVSFEWREWNSIVIEIEHCQWTNFLPHLCNFTMQLLYLKMRTSQYFTVKCNWKEIVTNNITNNITNPERKKFDKTCVNMNSDVNMNRGYKCLCVK